MLNEAIRGENTAVEDYDQALEITLPVETKILLEDHRQIIKSNIRAMERMVSIYEDVTA